MLKVTLKSLRKKIKVLSLLYGETYTLVLKMKKNYKNKFSFNQVNKQLSIFGAEKVKT